MSRFEHLVVEIDGALARVTLDRPDISLEAFCADIGLPAHIAERWGRFGVSGEMRQVFTLLAEQRRKMAEAIAEVRRQASPRRSRWPSATGQRPPRPWRALLARRAGRWPLSVWRNARAGMWSLRAGKGSAFPFPPVETAKIFTPS